MAEKILIINAGSSSVKSSLFLDGGETFRFQIEREGSHILATTMFNNLEEKHSIEEEKFINALETVISALYKSRAISHLDELQGVGFRVVHGGDLFTETVLLDPVVIQKLHTLDTLAPLHNPPSLKIIEAWFDLKLTVPAFAIFDTAFHTTIPVIAKTYAIPKALREKFGIHKYGFHGISCASIVHSFAPNIPPKLIVCHLGSGASVTAIQNGESVDTSMGMTPLEGIIMRTRAGDMDPGAVLELVKDLGGSGSVGEAVHSAERVLNSDSGFKALSGGIDDMREIVKQAQEGNTQCLETVEIYAYHVAKYIGSYFVVLGGCDALVFTAGTGEGSVFVREKILAHLSALGIHFSQEKNNQALHGNVEIQSTASHTKIFVLHTEEMQEMCREVQTALK